ncbi:HalOD1 output domain-containing protein [Halostella litorea]|uniref:HalOD1 output domain-containing protein n=1 Tax=Halostella litorea TaxID=2528831 RepID=UPI0010927F3B|nr:HalOD1 output domain-containing protein [Halostella litorea]
MNQVQTATAEAGNLSESVVEAMAKAESVDPMELTPPLYEVIDPDAIDRVFAPTPSNERRRGHLSFSYNGYVVNVSGDGSVCVEKPEE